MMQSILDSAGLSLVNPTDWKKSENFVKVLEYFSQNVRCFVQNKVLLIMDNQESYLSVNRLSYGKENAIVIRML